MKKFLLLLSAVGMIATACQTDTTTDNAIGIDNGADLAVGAIEDMNDEVYRAVSLPDYGAIGYSTDYTPAGAASYEPAMAGEYSETPMQPINVYIGQDKLDTVLVKANARMTYRAGR